MSSLHIRDIDPLVLGALKRLAKIHHRSLQGELHFILSQAARMAPPEGGLPPLDLHTVKTGATTIFSRDDIYGDDGR